MDSRRVMLELIKTYKGMRAIKSAKEGPEDEGAWVLGRLSNRLRWRKHPDTPQSKEFLFGFLSSSLGS